MTNRNRILACALAAAGLLLAGCPQRPEWTTSSEEALAEFQQGLDATMKYYHQESLDHLQRALELDPDFVAAKLFLLDHPMQYERRKALVDELRAADPESLNERERFLLQHTLAFFDGRIDEAEELRVAYLEKHPSDPWALAICSRRAWDEQDLEEAERLYLEQLEANPNWVLAQNHLGYLAMARGDFATAEERFRTYAYIAPDQANPHDSMGELLALLGRYDEARAALGKALEIKPDFCNSYLWLQMVEILDGDPAASERWVADAREAGCPQEFLVMLECQLGIWRAYVEGDWDMPFREEGDEQCHEWHRRHHLAHRMALYTGRTEEAVAMEERIREALERARAEMGRGDLDIGQAMLLHLRGFRALFDGDRETAVEKFQKADKLLMYWGGTQGVIKLYNKIHLALALEELGETGKSAAVRAEIEGINPSFAAGYDRLAEQLREVRARVG